MEDFHTLRGKLREKFYALVKSSESEERFIEIISLSLQKRNKFDIKALEVILDLCLTVDDQTGDLNYLNQYDSQNITQSGELDQQVINQDSNSYDADDEGLDETFIFPCHLTFDDCHPDQLFDYHRDHLKTTRTNSTQIVKHPKLCEFVLEFTFKSLKNQFNLAKNSRILANNPITYHNGIQPKLVNSEDNESYFSSIIKGSGSETIQILESMTSLIKRLNKVCSIEKKNCRILSRTNILDILMKNILYLIQEVPDQQQIYLEPLLRFAFTLSDYKITGSNLRQLFSIIKEENADTKVVLANFERLLNHHYRIFKNIQPSKSINFPTASKTAEEIESNSYILNSWHWRLRSKVIEFKRKRSRSISQSSSDIKNRLIKDLEVSVKDRDDARNSSIPERITPSWLECSIVAPLSNISPLIKNGEIKFSCSLWMSVCGDLLVIDETKSKRTPATTDENPRVEDWRATNGHWLRLTSRKRCSRQFKERVNNQKRARSRRLSAKLRKLKAYDKEDEEQEEIEERIKKSELELSQASQSINGLRFMQAPKIYSNSSFLKSRDTIDKNLAKTNEAAREKSKNPPKGFLGRRARDNSQELLMHLISFAIDTSTIEIWLNVKCMTFCARVCRVAREGQTNMLDQVTFPSHLEANGNWSHIIFSLSESNKIQNSNEKVMSLKVLVNGIHEEKEKLVYGANKSPLTNFACLIGCERSTFGYVWKLSQINIYKGNKSPKDVPMYLLGKGPDFYSFTNFKQQSTLPLPDITQRSIKNLMHPKLLTLYGAVDEGRSLNWLTQNIVIAYVAHQPDHFLDYSPSMTTSSIMNPLPADYEFSNSADRFIQARILNFTRSLKFNTNHGFGSALVEAGGIENVLLCFADVIRRAQETAKTHSLAFSILLKMSQTNQNHLNKFLDELNGLKLAEFILSHPDCVVSRSMLGYFLEFCLMKKGEHCLIKSPKLLYHLLSSWRAWHKDVKVARLLYRKLIRLLQPNETYRRSHSDERKVESYHINHNFKMMTEAGGIDILMSILRECLVPLDEGTPKINHELVELIVNLISLLIKHPPGLDVMLDIMEFLLFLHPDENAYVLTAPDRTLCLYELSCNNREPTMYDKATSRARTPLTETSFKSSNNSIDNNGYSESSFSRGQANFRSSSDEDVFKNFENQVREEYSENLTSFLINYNIEPSQRLNNSANFQWDKGGASNRYARSHLKQDNPFFSNQRCSNRDYAIANIADMLASIVKLTLTDPRKILSEALQKPIIDARKLIILANNSSSLVREKVLRLFLYCIRACYTLNLRSVLNKYEQDSKGSTFKLCSPIQLMARQLLKYPTTIKMIQLCYGIIVGIDEFETVETVCLIFDIETINNGLQLNTLILLVQLMTRLQEPKEIVSAVTFVHAYVKQLLQLGEADILSVLVKNNLIESLMKVYFNYVENEINICHGQVYEENPNDDYNQVKRELDKTLILVVQYYIQNLTTSETLKSIEDLLTYFDLMNTYVPHRYQCILRDRKVKVLATMLEYCKHYEECGRQKRCGGKMEYYLRSLFKNNDFNNAFPNVLDDSRSKLVEMLIDDDENTSSKNIVEPDENDGNFEQEINQQHLEVINEDSENGSNGSDDTYENGDDSNNQPKINGPPIDRKYINETDVIDRFKATLEFAVNFISTREQDVIPSPIERRFIVKCVKMLSSYLNEYQLIADRHSSKVQQRCRWFLMLPKLERPMRINFSRLILYLLSPCDSINLEERKYYALTLLEMFNVEQLIKLLDDGGSTKTTYKVLYAFTKELIDQNHSSFGDESDSDQDDDKILGDDIEVILKSLSANIELELGLVPPGHQSNGNAEKNKRARVTEVDAIVNTKIRDIWLEELALTREYARECAIRQGNQLINGCFSHDDTKNEDLNDKIDEASSITKDVIDDKNEQRKAYLEDLKQNKVFNYHIRQQWLSLIIGHTHERAIWYLEDHYPKSWELNPVEGPSRIRRRLRPCKLVLDSRYVRTKLYHQQSRQSHCEDSTSGYAGSESQPVLKLSSMDNIETSPSQQDLLADDWYSHYSPHPLCSMVINQEQSMDSNKLRIKMFTTDKIHFHCDANIIRPNEVCEGEVSIASWCIHFIGHRNDNYQRHISDRLIIHRDTQSKSRQGEVEGADSTNENQAFRRDFLCRRTNTFSTAIVEDLWFDEIVEIWDRRYQLQDVGLEVFLTNNMTYLFSFRHNKDREEFKQKLMAQQHKMINLQRFNLNTSLNRFTQLWRDGRMTNFDYLTCLNKLAGRSFNDLMQYPIFPFVLSNYTSKILDLNQPSNFRKLKKPMAIQIRDKEATFINNYHDSQSSNLSVGLCGMTKPYHYGNHYSNSATVLHFLVRLPPFTQMLIQYQDNNFDQPDRTFHSIANSWQLITQDSNTDFKELIPEFFFLPEMFVNFEQFELGRKQNNELVDDVKLPAWCPNSDARLFTLIHRQALESAYVSENLHHWIDLIFGYKQTGKAAVEAINVFHPATYYGMIDLSNQQQGSLTSPLNTTIASISARSSTYNSDYIISNTNDANICLSNTGLSENDVESSSRRKTLSQYRRQQADIERLALETMIKTYGQMPRQLFAVPMKQRSLSAYLQPIGTINYQAPNNGQMVKKLEPLRQVKGLKWGSFVGSPDENDITAVKHKRIVPEESVSKKVKQSLRHQVPNCPIFKFNFCLLPNGEIALLKNNTSLMLDYRADRKSGGAYQLSLPSARYSRRAGLSRVARMNLFSNMVISRQQFSCVETAHLIAGQFDSVNTTSSSLMALTSSRAKFSPESLSLVSWSYLDGIIRIRHPALNTQKSSAPLVQADSIVDVMSTCASVPELNLLLVGYKSGSICAHIVSTTYETVPTPQFIPTISPISASRAASSSSSAAAAPSAVHFLHTTTNSANLIDDVPLSAGKVSGSSINGEPYSAVSLAGKTLQSVRSINKATRWLYCHSKKINCIKINVSFGIVVTGGDDGTSVIWDLNSLTYVRTIDYKLKSLSKHKQPSSRSDKHYDDHQHRSRTAANSHRSDYLWPGQIDEHQLSDYLCDCDHLSESLFNNGTTNATKTNGRPLSGGADSGKHQRTTREQDNDYFHHHDQPCNSNLRETVKQCCICSSGINLIAISDTLGDIVSVKDINNRLALAFDCDDIKDDNGFDGDNTTDRVGYNGGGSSNGSGSGSCVGSSSDSEGNLSGTSATSTLSENSSSSVLYVHTINGALVGFVNCHTQATAVCYSNAPEGISVNVIVVGLADGLIRLYSSWDLSRVKEFHVSGLSSPINSLLYSRDNQLLYVAYEDGQMVVLRNKKRGSITLPKEWLLW